MIFTRDDFARLTTLFRPDYRGYRPEVIEAPNGDGNLDTGKRYLHVALKYDPPEWALRFLARAHFEACRVAETLHVPDRYYPRVADGTLRVLEYAPDAGSARHTDMSLFTITCFRNTTDGLVVEGESPECYIGELGEHAGLGPATSHLVEPRPHEQLAVVYFAVPDHSAIIFPYGEPAISVGDYLHDRKEQKSRFRVKGYYDG